MDKQINFEKLQSILKDLEHDSPDIISIITGIQNRLQMLEAKPAKLLEFTQHLQDTQSELITDSLFEATVQQYIATKPHEMHLLEFASYTPFQDLFMRLVEGCAFCDPKRQPIFKEILALYRQQYFAGSICLLYGQIEGLITDLLLYEGKIYRRWGLLFAKQQGKKPRKIIGLKLKIDVANAHPETQWITRLGAYSEFKTLGGNQRLTLSRNLVLHGDELNNLNQEHAFILIMWSYYLFAQADHRQKIKQRSKAKRTRPVTPTAS